MNASFQTIKKDLTSLGLKAGDMVIVHSSLSSMGNVDGGAKTVISAIQDIIGKNGTLMFPTFTYATVYNGEPFIHAQTPVCVGLIPETFRKMPGVIRSLHPTHSVAVWGKYAKELTAKHYQDETPMGINSPYRQLAKHGAKILMLGCSLNSTSYMHALEEEAGVEYCLRKDYVKYTITDESGNTYTKKYRRHNFTRPTGNVKQCYARCIDVLVPNLDYTVGKIHGATSYLIDAASLHEKAILKMKEDTYYFVDMSDVGTKTSSER